MSADDPTDPAPARVRADDATVSADADRAVVPTRTTGAPGQVYARGELVADRYRITRLLGRGGMGEVYEAHDRALDQQVALKTLPLDRSDAADRLDRELVLARRIAHPGVCRLFDLGVDERERRFVTMERLDGETLADRLAREGPLPPTEVSAIVRDLAAALTAAHDAGVIHRDLKPHNVFLAEPAGGGAARVVIMDFGLARHDGDSRASITDFAGTPAYMAPEQLTSRRVTTAVDIYALGVLVFELLTGRLPFEGDGALATAVSRLQAAPPHLREADGPDDAGWDRLIQACLAIDPAARPTAAAVPALIDAPPPPPPRRRGALRRYAPLLAIPALAAGAAAVALSGGDARRPPAIDRGARVPFAFSLGGESDDNVNTLAWAADGDLFVGGHVAVGAQLGGHRLGRADAATHGAYIARTSRVGGVRWAWTAGGDTDVRVTALTTTPDGDVVAAGIHFQAVTIGGTTLPKASSDGGGFVVRLDGETGAVRWARAIASTTTLFLRAIAVDADGAIYVTGVYIGELSYAGTTADAGGPKATSSSPMVASLTADGAPRWLVAGRGAGAAKAFGLATDGGRVIMTGMAFDAFELGGVAFPSRGPGDAIVIALDTATGAMIWHQMFQSTGPPERSAADVTAVAARDGRVVVAGNFQSGLTVGPLHLPTKAWMSAFVTELAAADGTPRWAFAIGGKGTSNPATIALTADGRAIIAGKIRGDVLFGATEVPGVGDEDALIGVLARDGTPIAVQRLGGTARDRARAVAVAPDGLIAVGGMFAGAFDAGRFHLTGRGATDGFVVQLDLAVPE